MTEEDSGKLFSAIALTLFWVIYLACKEYKTSRMVKAVKSGGGKAGSLDEALFLYSVIKSDCNDIDLRYFETYEQTLLSKRKLKKKIAELEDNKIHLTPALWLLNCFISDALNSIKSGNCTLYAGSLDMQGMAWRKLFIFCMRKLPEYGYTIENGVIWTEQDSENEINGLDKLISGL